MITNETFHDLIRTGNYFHLMGFHGVRFHTALCDVDFARCTFLQSSFESVSFSTCTFDYCLFIGCDFSAPGAFRVASLNRAMFIGCEGFVLPDNAKDCTVIGTK